MQDREQSLLHRIGAVAASAGSGSPRRPKIRFAIRLALGLAIFASLVYAVASQWTELRAEHLQLDPVWLAPALVVLIALHAIAAFGWDLVLRALGHELRPARAQMAWAQSLLARYVPGGLLMIVGRVLLSEREGVPRRTTLASMVYEAGLMVVVALVVGSWSLVSSDALGGAAERIAALALAPLLLVFMHPRIFGPLANRALSAFGRDPLPSIIRFRTVLSLLLYYLVVWIFFGVGAFLAAKAVYNVGLSDLPAVMAAQALGYSAAVITVVFPGGLGIRDGAFALVLDSVLPGGFALAAAIAIAVRLVTTVAELIYAGGATVLGRRTEHRGAAQALRDAT